MQATLRGMVMVEGGSRIGPRLRSAADGDPDRPMHASLVDAHLRAGRLAAALATADLVLARPLAPHDRDTTIGLRGLALALAGRTEDAIATLAEADGAVRDGDEGQATILSCWAEVALWGGLPRQAIDRATAALACRPAPDDLVRAALARSWAELELEHRLSPPPIEIAHPSRRAALLELRGIEAFAKGSWHAASASFDDAATHWAARDRSRALVCRWAAADARRRGDHDAAVEELRAALDAAAEMGFEPLAARVRRSLRLAGQRPASPRRPRIEGRLTSREAEVLELVERGRTNDEIARRMGLGRPTVARILSNAMVKLGAESRAQAIVINGCGDTAARIIESHGPLDADGTAVPDDARAILSRIALGRTLGAIARELGLSRRTADRRLADARAALGAARTTEAVARAQRLGWLS